MMAVDDVGERDPRLARKTVLAQRHHSLKGADAGMWDPGGFTTQIGLPVRVALTYIVDAAAVASEPRPERNVTGIVCGFLPDRFMVIRQGMPPIPVEMRENRGHIDHRTRRRVTPSGRSASRTTTS